MITAATCVPVCTFNYTKYINNNQSFANNKNFILFSFKNYQQLLLLFKIIIFIDVNKEMTQLKMINCYKVFFSFFLSIFIFIYMLNVQFINQYFIRYTYLSKYIINCVESIHILYISCRIFKKELQLNGCLRY